MNHKSLLFLAKSITKKTGIKVIIGRDAMAASTDGRIIRLPYIKEIRHFSKALMGYLYHEAAHVLWTDFSEENIHFRNSIEDVRIERKAMQKWPSSRSAIQAMDEYLIKKAGFPPITMMDNPFNVLQMSIIYSGGSEDGISCLEPLLEDLDHVGKIWFREEFFRGFKEKILANLKSTKTTDDSSTLSDALMEMLREELQYLRNAGMGDSPWALNVEEILAQAEPAPGIQIPNPKHDVFDQEIDALGESDRRVSVRVTGKERGMPSDEALARSNKISVAISQVLEQLEAGRTANVPVITDRGKSLDRRCLAAAVAGSGNVFRKSIQTFDKATVVVLILLDTSLSMGGEKLEMAKQAVLGLGLAMDGLANTTFAIARFPVREFNVEVLTDFSESTVNTLNRYAFGSGGYTPLDSALAFCRQELLGQMVDRRVIIVVTDGVPDNLEYAQDEIRGCADDGISTIGVGIGDSADYVQNTFPKGIVTSIDSLPSALEGVIKEVLYED